MRELTVTFSINDEDYADLVTNIVDCLLTREHPWMPGFLFKKVNSWHIDLDNPKGEPNE